VAESRGVILREREAERLTVELGAAYGITARDTRRAVGIDRRRGREAEVEVCSSEVTEAIRPVVASIAETVRGALVSLDHKAAAEVIETGICLTGGGALLRGMDEVIACATSVEVRIAPDPLRAVIGGAGRMLDVGAATRLWRA
jgi:rod shape-determining protein MreB